MPLIDWNKFNEKTNLYLIYNLKGRFWIINVKIDFQTSKPLRLNKKFILRCLDLYTYLSQELLLHKT